MMKPIRELPFAPAGYVGGILVVGLFLQGLSTFWGGEAPRPT